MDPCALAANLAQGVAEGHFDEMSAPAWRSFFGHLGVEGFRDLDRRSRQLQRQVRDNGVTYNVYADADGPQRPWSLDLFPLIIPAQDWRRIEVGVQQRVRLLDRVMADVYGPQRLLAEGLLPSALVQGHPGYLRPMHGIAPVGGTHLPIAAFDMARNPKGEWWVVSQRTQAPSGLGYLLENRIAVSRQFPAAFRDMHVQRLAASYRALIDGLKRMSPAGESSRIVLLTPGPYNETYFEHAYLARYLGLTLVEGSDLTVRDQRLYIRTLKGLEPVHALLKRLDDEFLDPLELRADSRLGVPGLLQVMRAGNVLVANAPGSAFLESSALLGFLPALSRRLLGEELSLPSLDTWWCGERAAMESVLPQLGERVIKPTYPDAFMGISSVLGRTLSQRELDEWAGRIVRQGDAHTVQAYLPMSQMPTWHERRLAPRSVMLRVFAVCDGPGSWCVLPGGLARIATADLDIASMQRGGSSADVWVLTEGPVDTSTNLPTEVAPDAQAALSRSVTSRAAENLFWLGRYTERTENTLRLARLALEGLNGEDQSSQPLLSWLGQLAVTHGLVLDKVPPAAQAPRVFERSLIASLSDTVHSTSVGYNLVALKSAAAAVRERLSQEHWNVILRAESDFFSQCANASVDSDYSCVESLRVLDHLGGYLAAMTGAQTDRMTRDDGWRLLSTGRHIERLSFLAAALASGFETGSIHDDSGFEAMVALFDSTISFHARFQQRRDVPALIDLLMMDRDNPRSLGWVLQTLRGRLARLAGSEPGTLPAMARDLPDPQAWFLDTLCQRDNQGGHARLVDELRRCVQSAHQLSDLLGARYFSHSIEARQSLGA
ncbi:MAG: circularly permuted type 2 ATP-grasp protein [Burkholderiaceae bacterium]|nr:circularly permuted type 2 ATP-grasp protein [Burkholderiaceae bacterium]